MRVIGWILIACAVMSLIGRPADVANELVSHKDDEDAIAYGIGYVLGALGIPILLFIVGVNCLSKANRRDREKDQQAT